jgi:hypothetical protein
MIKKIFIYMFGTMLACTLITNDTLMAGGKTRLVKILWDSVDGELKLSTKVKTNALQQETAPYLFKLKRKDRVLLQMEGEKEATLEISYKISGQDVVVEFQKGIPLFLEPDTPPERKAVPQKSPPSIKVVTVPVTDDLLAGGTLTITFKKTISVPGKKGVTEITKIKEGNKSIEIQKGTPPGKAREKVTEKTLTFRVKDGAPWFFTSTGVVLTNESNHSVVFVKTSETKTVEKDGETEEVFEQVISLKDKRENNKMWDLRPKQTLVQFIHFRITGITYFSIGAPINKKIFSDPLFGVSFFSRYKKIGFAITAGVHLHKEISIEKISGFEEGMIIDPTKITAEEIPTENPHRVRFFIGVSFKL